MDEKPNYYAIIPADVRYDNNLTPSEKLFYGEITALTQKTGECWASNSYFAKLYGVSTRSITNWVSHLEKYKYIQTETINKDNSKEIEKRVIRLPIENNFYTYRKKVLEGYRKKELGGIENNFQENNTSNNNTSINNKEIYKESIEEIINYLNNKIDTHYKTTTPKTKQLITARLNEGFTVEDFKKVIENKYSTWFKDKKMCNYLRPETLFGTKFENYLNEKVKKRLSDEELIKMLEEME